MSHSICYKLGLPICFACSLTGSKCWIEEYETMFKSEIDSIEVMLYLYEQELAKEAKTDIQYGAYMLAALTRIDHPNAARLLKLITIL